MNGKMVTTYTMWSLFRNCRKACQWRYLDCLVPLEKEPALAFGSLIHACLEIWHRTRDMVCVLDYIDRAYVNRAQDPEEKRDWHLANAMMCGYRDRYPQEDFEVVALEREFQGEIRNPASLACSRSFVLAGKVDGIVKIGSEYFLLEHKTASQLDGDYLERLWTDFQIILYARYIEECFGIRIAGIIYNVLVKARLQQSLGETEGEFEVRRAELLAKSKTGRTTAQRKLPESDADYRARLAAKYTDIEMFHRETLYISRDQYDILASELWELTQAFLDARRRNVFYQNTSFCFQYHRPCSYFPLCRSGGNPNVMDNFYRHLPPHEELGAPIPVEAAPFVPVSESHVLQEIPVF